MATTASAATIAKLRANIGRRECIVSTAPHRDQHGVAICIYRMLHQPSSGGASGEKIAERLYFELWSVRDLHAFLPAATSVGRH